MESEKMGNNQHKMKIEIEEVNSENREEKANYVRYGVERKRGRENVIRNDSCKKMEKRLVRKDQENN